MPLQRCGKPDTFNAVVRSASSVYKSVGVVDPSSGRRKNNPSISGEELNRLHFESGKMPRSGKNKLKIDMLIRGRVMAKREDGLEYIGRAGEFGSRRSELPEDRMQRRR